MSFSERNSALENVDIQEDFWGDMSREDNIEEFEILEDWEFVLGGETESSSENFDPSLIPIAQNSNEKVGDDEEETEGEEEGESQKIGNVVNSEIETSDILVDKTPPSEIHQHEKKEEPGLVVGKKTQPEPKTITEDKRKRYPEIPPGLLRSVTNIQKYKTRIEKAVNENLKKELLESAKNGLRLNFDLVIMRVKCLKIELIVDCINFAKDNEMRKYILQNQTLITTCDIEDLIQRTGTGHLFGGLCEVERSFMRFNKKKVVTGENYYDDDDDDDEEEEEEDDAISGFIPRGPLEQIGMEQEEEDDLFAVAEDDDGDGKPAKLEMDEEESNIRKNAVLKIHKKRRKKKKKKKKKKRKDEDEEDEGEIEEEQKKKKKKRKKKRKKKKEYVSGNILMRSVSNILAMKNKVAQKLNVNYKEQLVFAAKEGKKILFDLTIMKITNLRMELIVECIDIAKDDEMKRHILSNRTLISICDILELVHRTGTGYLFNDPNFIERSFMIY